MKQLVELTDAGGNPFYINPEHVVLVVTSVSSGGAAVIGHCAVATVLGQGLQVRGSIHEIATKLEGRLLLE